LIRFETVIYKDDSPTGFGSFLFWQTPSRELALKQGMEEKSKEFAEKRNELYAKACDSFQRKGAETQRKVAGVLLAWTGKRTLVPLFDSHDGRRNLPNRSAK